MISNQIVFLILSFVLGIGSVRVAHAYFVFVSNDIAALHYIFNFSGLSTCGFPGAPAHSSVQFSEGSTGDRVAAGGIAEYTCDRGFELLGPARRVCSQNGTWSPQGIPFCGRFSCYPTPFTQPHPFPFVITMRDAYLWYRCNTIPHHLASCHPHREDRTHALCETVFPANTLRSSCHC